MASMRDIKRRRSSIQGTQQITKAMKLVSDAFQGELEADQMMEDQRTRFKELRAELKDLEYLELFTCGIRDITPLTKLPKLMDLNLANNSVKDWRPLKEMKQLKRLWISDMGEHALTAAEKQELEEALPGTVIMYKGKPTDNGWRTDPKTKVNDPHYDIVYEIFHTGVYIPFEESAPLPGEAPADWVVEDADIEEETLNP